MAKFTLELARLSGTPEVWLKRFDKEFVINRRSCKLLDSKLHEFEDLYSFLDNDTKQLGEDLQFLRLFAGNSGVRFWNAIDYLIDSVRQLLGFSAAESERVPSWRIIKYLCKVANQSESFYRGIYEEQWVRTVSESHPLEKCELVFHSNVVPRQAYYSRMAPMNGVCSRQGCTGGFFRILPDLEDPRLSQCSGKCDLAEQLNPRYQPVRAAGVTRYSPLLPSEDEETFVNTLTGGADGDVAKVLWRKGLFAKKEFKQWGNGQANPSFLNELKVAKEVSHPNIVHCFLTNPNSFSLTMELLENDLEGGLVDLSRTEDQFSFRESLLVLLQIAKAMKHLHDRDFVHGDLKPGNIFISRLAMPHSDASNRFYLVKVGDFGRTQCVDTAGALQSFQFNIGSNYYTAPEVFIYRSRRQLQPVPQRSDLKKIDVYSFGVVAYQVLTGLPPIKMEKGEDWKLEEKKPSFINFLLSSLLSFLRSLLFGFLHGFSLHKNRGIPSKAFSIPGVKKPDGDINQWRPSCVVVGDLNDDRSKLLPLVTECWSSFPQNRPDFTEICEKIQKIYEESFPCT